MSDFFENNYKVFLYGLVVVGVVALFVLLTNLLHKWLINKAKKKHPNEEPTTVNLIKRVFNILWYLLGFISLSVIFLDKKFHNLINENFKLTLYLGIVAIFTIIGGSIVQTLFSRAIKKKNQIDGDPTSYKFLGYLAVFGVYFIGIMLAILAFPSLRGVTQTALGGAGVLAVIAGIASQEAMANIVSGVFIISFKPFQIGHVIKVSDELVGTVTDITLRHTIIRNYKNKMIVIPNAVINKAELINYDLGEKKCCQWIEVGISYGSSIDQAKKIIQEECEYHKFQLDNRTFSEKKEGIPEVIVRVLSLDDSAVTIRAWVWAKDYPTAFVMKCELIEIIKKRFDEEGIEIPFPHRTMVFKENQLKELALNIKKSN